MRHETLAGLLVAGRRQLQQAGIETAHLDARLLLQHATQLSHETLIVDPNQTVDFKALGAFEAFIQRRLRREPVSRILGEREFYGRLFKLSPATLDPRPATETLIEVSLAVLEARARILDLGAGTGAIIVTLLAEAPSCTGLAVDISPEALEIATQNAQLHHVADRLELHCSNWFERVDGRFDLIVSNPPYIAATDIAALAPDVRNFDPRTALDGGVDGLEAYRKIAADAGSHLKPSGSIIVEIGAGQHDAVVTIFASHGFALAGVRRDLEGHLRCLHFAASC
jgi:release factor glutamine methyltransferase